MLTHLLFMRHAKSSWDDDSLTDHERPLNKRGRKQADAVARTLTAKGLAPDTIWASDAERTSETAARLIRIIPGAQTIIRVPQFYHASAAQVSEKCRNAAEPDGRLMLLGHNPGWSELASFYTGQSLDMPTACCLVFERVKQESENWIASENWRFIDRLNAKDLLLDEQE